VFKQATLAPKIRGAFERAVELDPKNAAARYGLGSFYLQAPAFMGGDLQKAAAQTRSLLDAGAPLGELLQARIYEKQGEPVLAEATYDKLQRNGRFPDLVALHANYGRFLLERKRYQQAIEQFQQQLALTPADATAHKRLGDSYRAIGRPGEAAAAYEAAAVLKNVRVAAGS
jgi:tetratricopeptide (TPR) repeat protein